MSVRAYRKLKFEQLVKLTQVYWDDPGKLAELAEVLEARRESGAERLRLLITGRIEHVKSDPAARREEAPNFAALGFKVAAEPEDEEAPAAGSPVQPVEEEKKPDRRRIAALILGVAALLLLVWFLWPARKTVDEETVAKAPGEEVFEQGVPRQMELPRGAAPSSPEGRRRPEELDPREIERQQRETGARESASRPLAASRDAPVPRVRDPGEIVTLRPPRATGGAAGGGGSSPPGGGVAPPSPSSAARAPAASGSVIVDAARLECYLTDDRPTACSTAGGGGSGGGSGGPGAAAGGGAAAPAAGGSGPAPASGGGSSGAAPGQQQQLAASPSRASPSGSGGGGSPSPGSGAASSSASSAGGGSAPAAAGTAATARRSPSGAASGGAGGSASSSPPPAVAPPAASAAVPPVPPAPASPPDDPQCPVAPAAGRIVVVFDGSISMGLPLGLDPALEDRLDEGVRNRDPASRAAYRALLAEPGFKRMGRAQEAFADAVDNLAPPVELGLVVFQECRDIRQVGIFDAAGRGTATGYIRALVPRGRTPLAQSLLSAAAMLGDGRSSIVLVTDGREYCRGDPCAVARQIQAQHPATAVQVVDITGQAKAECVAEITGGRLYQPSEAEDLARVINLAFRGAAPHCAE